MHPSDRSSAFPHVYIQSGALPALKSLELRGITFGLDSTDILPHLRTLVACNSPINDSCPHAR